MYAFGQGHGAYNCLLIFNWPLSISGVEIEGRKTMKQVTYLSGFGWIWGFTGAGFAAWLSGFGQVTGCGVIRGLAWKAFNGRLLALGTVKDGQRPGREPPPHLFQG